MSRQITELVFPADTTDLRVMTTHLEFFSENQQLAQIQRIREIHEEAFNQFHNPGKDMQNTPFELVSRLKKLSYVVISILFQTVYITER